MRRCAAASPSRPGQRCSACSTTWRMVDGPESWSWRWNALPAAIPPTRASWLTPLSTAIQKSSLQIRSMTRVTNLTRNILSSAFLCPGGSIRLSTDGSSAAAGPLCPRENISPARPPTAMNAISCPVKRGTPCASSRSRPRLSARSTTGTSTENSSPTAPSARSAPIRSPSGWMPGASPPPPAVNGRPAL